MSALNVKNLDDLLRDYIGADAKIVDHKVKYLTAPGDNYGSTVLSIELTIKQNGSTKTIQTVAKTLPESEFFRAAVNVQAIGKKELLIYRDVGPALVNLQKQYGISEDKILDVLPKFYGGRWNLNGSDVVDDDALLVVEDLRPLGYNIGDRLVGFDLEESLFVLKHLARFQGLVVALRTLKPDEFKTAVLPSVESVKLGSEAFKKEMNSYAQELRKFFSGIDDLAPHADKAAQYISETWEFPHSFIEPKEPFATVNHNDFWVSNMMLRKENGKPVDIKFLDFQATLYGSPVHDILFFFYTSIQSEVLQENFDTFLDYYYQNFVECLQDFKIDIDPFSREAFYKEFDEYALSQFGHIFLIMKGVLTDKEKIKDIDVLGEGSFTVKIVADVFFTRAVNLFREYLKRGWFK